MIPIKMLKKVVAEAERAGVKDVSIITGTAWHTFKTQSGDWSLDIPDSTNDKGKPTLYITEKKEV